jgi:flagellar motor switch protein FliM
VSETILNQAEIASLVGSSESAKGQAAALRRFDGEGARDVVPSTPYDFGCADRLGPEAMRALEAIHEGAAGRFAAATSSLVRTSVETHVARVEEVTYAEFLRDLKAPTSFNLVRSAGLATNLAIDINPTILYPLIDRLLGGGHEVSQPVERPLTQIERRLAARVTRILLDALESSWQSVFDTDFELVRIEADPQLVHVVSPSELVVRVVFDVRMADVRAMVRVGLPCAAIDAVRDRLVRAAASTARRPMPALADVHSSGGGSPADAAELSVEIARVRIAAGEIADLHVGDIITSEQSVANPLLVKVDGAARFHARAGAYRGRKAIAIEGAIETPGPET